MRQPYISRAGACCAAAFAVFMTTQAAMAQGGPIVISQLFGGGGQTAAGPNGDFIELFNRSCVAVNLDGYSVQTTNGGSGTVWQVIPLPNFQLDPGKYYCIRLTNTTPTGVAFNHDLQQTTLTPSGDLLVSGNGKAAIVLGDTPLPTGNCPISASIVDFVKYENVSSACSEGNSVGVGTQLSANGRCISRRTDANGDGVGDGCQDTNNNSADFMIDLDPCFPRNNAGPANNCPGAPIFGGCNLGDGSCRIVAGVAACNALGGSYLGNCTPCVAPQACCLPTSPVTCVVQSQAQCQNDGGLFHPGEFSCPPSFGCPPLGRCCSPDGNCVVTFSALCVSPNTYGGDGTDCSQPETCQGRCCNPDGSCTLTGQVNCLAPNTFGGVGTNCQNLRLYGNPNPPTVLVPATGTGPGPSVPSIINVPENFTIQDVNVRVKIQHTFRGDLIVCLTGPGGSPVVRMSPAIDCAPPTTVVTGGECAGADNFNVIWDDEGLPINCASVNLTNLGNPPDNVIPSESLSAFDGLPSAGDWTLSVHDDQGGDSGTLLEWELQLDDGNACQGACCRTNGSCFVTGELPCQQQGGTFQGAGVGCSPSPCAANGACCIGTGCSQQSAIDCAANGGVFGGVNSSCTEAPCFVPCCKSDGVCDLRTLDSCNALGDAFPGTLGAPCSAGPCLGACCAPDGSCSLRTPPGSLTGSCDSPSEFRGLGTNCDDPGLCQGRCCSPDGSCSLTGAANCLAPNTFGGVGTNCQNLRSYGNPNPPTVLVPATGTGPGPSVPSIINVPENFTIQDVNVRVKIQHTFRGDLIVCLTAPGGSPVVRLSQAIDCAPPTTVVSGGNCLGEDNLNAIFDDEGLPINCASVNLTNLGNPPDNVIPSESLSAFDGLPSAGDWTLSVHDDQGGDSGTLLEWELQLDDGNACQGACCRTNGSCVILSQMACQQQGGTYQGAGTGCSPSPCSANGACCIGGVCSQQSQIDCIANGGVFAGAGSSCTNAPCFVPCCKPEGLCQLLTSAACAATGGVPVGAAGTACPSVSCQGRCCSPDGNCNVTYSFNCTSPSVYGGNGTNCDNPSDCIGRCCGGDGSCSESGPGNCNGTFGGVGTSCNAGYDISTIALDFTDIAFSGAIVTGVNQVDDGNSGAIPLGFDFDFYGATQNQIFVNANGFISFNTITGLNYLNQLIPTAAIPNNAIFGLWDDLYPPGIAASRITSELTGSPGSQVFIIQWTNVPQFNNTSGNNTFQIKLFEGSNRIEIHYQSVEITEIDTIAGGPGTSVGVENADGTVGQQYLTPEVLRASLGGGGTALRFAPSVPCTPGGGCNCRGDVNGDAVVNGKDVNAFAQCVASGGAGCPCADMNNSGSANSADVSAFVTAVITGNCGP